ncbi:MAG: carboxylesterase family protein [Parvularculaceae bacterium]
MTQPTRRDAGKAVAASALALAGFGASASDWPLVHTNCGPVRGFVDRGVHVFLGVRYGADTRALRFRKPLAPTPWNEPVEAAAFAPAAAQAGALGPGSEDCLFLNVWTPNTDPEARRPAMVYFHGGGYATGSTADPQTDGLQLARAGDVVVVTIGHRLNAFGYLSLRLLFPERAPDSGNAGQWDLDLALRWVRDNIAAFGGDPGRVMLFGQSGGGAKIATLMASPAARGLFHASATMSGQQVTASGPLNAAQRAGAFLDALGIDPRAPGAWGALDALEAEKLIGALSTPDPVDPSRGGIYFGPVVDGGMLARHPFWPEAPAQSADIPMILGNTRDETRSLIGRAEPSAFTLRPDDLPALLARHMRCDIDPNLVIETYRREKPDISPSDLFFDATTAARSWRGQVEEADARARQGARTWVYRYDLPSPLDGGRWGAPHTIDIAPVFGTLGAQGAYAGSDNDARRVSAELMGALIALARTGDPDHKGLPHWPAYTLAHRETMLFDRRTRVASDPRSFARTLFASVPFIQWGT